MVISDCLTRFSADFSFRLCLSVSFFRLSVRSLGVAADIVQHQFAHGFPADGVGGATLLPVVLVKQAGEIFALLFLGVVRKIQSGAASGAPHQSGEHLDFSLFTFPPVISSSFCPRKAQASCTTSSSLVNTGRSHSLLGYRLPAPETYGLSA